MTTFETQVFTDAGDLIGQDVGLGTSHALAGKGCKREGKTSPRLRQRRSSRIRQRDGTRSEVTDESVTSSSDDSDPNIRMEDEVLIEDEERMMMEEERDVDMTQRADKQILAVALMKSVLESNKSDKVIKSDKVKKENNSVQAETVGESSGLGVDSSARVKIEESDNGSTSAVEITQTNSVQNDNAIQTGIKEESNIGLQKENSTPTKVTKPKPTKSQAAQPTVTSKSSSYRSTRSRSKGSKNGRTMALKGAYASIREAPRVARKPNVSIPVPNPILPSPATIEPKQEQQNTDVVDTTMTDVSKDMLQAQSNNSLEQNSTRSRTNSLSQTYSKHPGNPQLNTANNATSRRRIFSIDFDPDGFDFDLSIGVDCTDNASALPSLPPIAGSSTTTAKRDFDSMPSARTRGMSFELFAFSGDPLDLKEEALNGGRPRGDSIIFDPVSFTDGGIHEETALQRLRQNSTVLEESDEIALMNTPGFVEVQPLHVAHNRQIPHNSRSATSHRNKNSRGLSRSSKSSSNRHSKSNSPAAKAKSHITMTFVSGQGLHNSENTIHVPQGSAAAAAAAASLSSQIIPCTVNGTISHTAIPMELLNKGGRIGIYLPDARRERIAKFHSKRKNRIWRKRIKYDCRKKLADSRPRIKGRFVKSMED